MVVSTALTKAYKGWPDVQTVVVHMRRNDVDVYREVTHAMKRSNTSSELVTSGVSLRGDDTVFNLPVDLMKNAAGKEDVVRERDRILETTLADLNEANQDMVTWVVKSVGKVSRGTRWRAVCAEER